MNKDFYEELPSFVCEQLDKLIDNYKAETWFHEAWEKYRKHVLEMYNNKEEIKMPEFVFNEYLKGRLPNITTKPDPNVMDNITFKQFLVVFNFRDVNEEGATTKEQLNTKIIRIYFSPEMGIGDNEYIEFGMYDYASKKRSLEVANKVFSKDIMNSYVENIEENENGLEVYLTEDKEAIID